MINEISKKTLGSYIKKAGVSAADMAHRRAYADNNAIQHKMRGDKEAEKIADARGQKASRKEERRHTGIAKAVSRLTKEALELVESRNIVDFKALIKEELSDRVVDLFAEDTGPDEDDEPEFDFDLDDLESIEDLPEAFLAYVAENISDEDFEQLDELSKGTLKSYVKKAGTSSQRSWAKADKEEDKAMSTDGIKYPDKQRRHQDAANKAIGTWKKRVNGIDKASKKLKEEVSE